MIEKPPVRLERYATMRAEIDAGGAVDQVIGRAKITSDIWDQAQAFWQKRLAEDAKAKRTETTKRYQTLYTTKKRIFEKKLAIQAREARTPEGSLAAPTQPPVGAPETMPPPPSVAAAPTTSFAASPVAAPPMVRAAPPPAPVAPPPVAPPPSVRQPVHAQPLTREMSLDQLLAQSKATPFQSESTPEMGQQGGSTRTMAVDINQLLAQSKATPFQSEPMPEMEEEGGSIRTMAVDMNQLLAQAKATPFRAAPTSSRPTATLPGEPPESQRSALPFTQAARDSEAGAKKIFNINQFAALTAEIAESPTTVADIRKRYRITEAQHLEESQRWTAEFRENASLRESYLGIVRHYREYLKKPGG